MPKRCHYSVRKGHIINMVQAPCRQCLHIGWFNLFAFLLKCERHARALRCCLGRATGSHLRLVHHFDRRAVNYVARRAVFGGSLLAPCKCAVDFRRASNWPSTSNCQALARFVAFYLPSEDSMWALLGFTFSRVDAFIRPKQSEIARRATATAFARRKAWLLMLFLGEGATARCQ